MTVTGCAADEHWVQQSCHCGLRLFPYDRIAHMEGDGMQAMAQEMAARGHLDKAFLETGWGKDDTEPFLGSNTVFHQTGASESWRTYYSLTAYPGVFDRVVQVHADDIARFGYTAEVEQMREQLQADAAAAKSDGA